VKIDLNTFFYDLFFIVNIFVLVTLNPISPITYVIGLKGHENHRLGEKLKSMSDFFGKLN
jgi:hypothetical protein